jgi:hypothetical protein
MYRSLITQYAWISHQFLTPVCIELTIYKNGVSIYVHCLLVLSDLAPSALWCALGGLKASIRKVREAPTCVL